MIAEPEPVEYRYQLELPDGRVATFAPNGRKRVLLRDGFVLVNADIKLADGTMMNGIVEIDEGSSGEHGGTYFMLGPDLLHQGEEDFFDRMGKTEQEIYPYRYRPRAKLNCVNHHLDADGWSR